MPHLFSFATGYGSDNDALQETEQELPQKPRRRPSLLKGIGSLLKRQQHQPLESLPQTAPPDQTELSEYFPVRRRSLQDSNSKTRKAIPSLPRPQTFRRQESEKRERLQEVQPSPTEKRAVSAERRRCLSAGAARRRSRSPQPIPLPSLSAPEVGTPDQQAPIQSSDDQSTNAAHEKPSRNVPDLPPLQIPNELDGGPVYELEDEPNVDKAFIQDEYDKRWILNLSMHFRDKSNREKFFVTYAETPSKWRRITVSLDYRNAPEGSLEADLSNLHYQCDKSFRIYESIRESLPDIQYYETVTNLKLETMPEDGQLHVHVREDANEIIQYPSASLFQHIGARSYAENDIDFISHLSGFVYKVCADGRTMIKKEIPGPDTVDEFLYEVNALDSLTGCENVIQLEGLVTDEMGSVIKGLLISYASQGALVDMLYDFRGGPEPPWHRREKWAKQIVQGLSDIHEAGFVQGDFTLSNIVIDEYDNAQIIDINRRGCPVGWEPPELSCLIDSGQRIGMCIGVKTDLFQLGMVLWALAEEVDEPERVERPLPPVHNRLPSYFRDIVDACLSTRPQGRLAANRLLRMFPASAGVPRSSRPSVDLMEQLQFSNNSVSTHRSDKEYIDPNMAITLEEVRRRRADTCASDLTSGQVTYVDPDSNAASTSYHFESSGSWIVGHQRGRSPASSRRRRSSPFGRSPSSATSLSSEGPARRREPCSTDDEACEDEKADEHTMSLTYPSEISADDLKLPEIVLSEKALDREQSTPRPITNKRIDVLRRDDFTQLVHTDSGFDEQMVEELQLDGSHEASGGRRGCYEGEVVEARSHNDHETRQL